MAEAQKSGTGVLWLGLGIVGAAMLYRRVITPKILVPLQTKAYVMKLRVNMPTVRFKGDNVEFDLYVQNPNDKPMVVKAVVGDVYVTSAKEKQTIKLGNITRYGTTIIKPVGETKFTFSVRLKFINLLAHFNNILAGKVTGQIFSFKGYININGQLYPINPSYRLG